MAKLKDIEHYKSPGNTIIAKATTAAAKQGAIFIPEESQESNSFEVIGIGLKFDCEGVNIGDTVLISGKGGDRIDLGDTTYWIFPTDLIVAVIEL